VIEKAFFLAERLVLSHKLYLPSKWNKIKLLACTFSTIDNPVRAKTWQQHDVGLACDFLVTLPGSSVCPKLIRG
jgi:hypothetical protein